MFGLLVSLKVTFNKKSVNILVDRGIMDTRWQQKLADGVLFTHGGTVYHKSRSAFVPYEKPIGHVDKNSCKWVNIIM